MSSSMQNQARYLSGEKDSTSTQRDDLAAAITDLFEARRLLSRSRMGYPLEDFNSTYFEASARKGDALSRPAGPSLAHRPAAAGPSASRSFLKQTILSLCGSSPKAMKALAWTTSRARSTVAVAKLAAQYPGSTDRLSIKIQARAALVSGFPEALAGLKAARAGWRSVRGTDHRPLASLASPYNLERFDARTTRTLYLHDLLGDPAIVGDFQSALEQMLNHAERHGRFSTCVALNFYAGGGAETATLHYVDHYASRLDGSVLLILTDAGPQKALPALPENVFLLDIETFRGVQTFDQRQSILFNSLLTLRPHLLHIVNSATAWEFLHQMPARFFPDMKVISSNFALQFADRERKAVVGYAATNLPRAMGKLDAVVTDNRRFAEEGIETIDLAEHREKVHVIYNPSNLGDVVSGEDAERRLEARLEDMASSPRLKVVWAGRLDDEKRVDLLLDTARLCSDFCDFHVYGGVVVSHGGGVRDELRSQANVFLKGPFASPLEWERDGLKHVFFFTSRWEGMPNVLIESAYLGMPVCAMDVGGVKELIGDDTGWLLGERDSASRFATVFKQLAANPQDVERRTRNLIHRVRSQHSRPSFAAQMDRLIASLDLGTTGLTEERREGEVAEKAPPPGTSESLSAAVDPR